MLHPISINDLITTSDIVPKRIKDYVYWNSYYSWLYSLVTSELEKDYSKLLIHLWETPFISLLPNDENREFDGLALRAEYCNTVIFMDKNILQNYRVSCLEVLIALSRRMNFELSNTPFMKTTQECFWELIHNLRLHYFHNANYEPRGRVEECDDIVQHWLHRKYLNNGIGGLFPLRRPKTNQTVTEIWYQMMAYLEENYHI